MTKAVSVLSLVFFALPQHSLAETKADCDTALSPSSQSSALKKTFFGGTPDEAVVSKPEKDDPDEGLFYAGQTSQLGSYEVRRHPKNNRVTGFSFTNLGPNSIVKGSPKGLPAIPARDFDFDFPDRARREISLNITDRTSQTLTEYLGTKIMFFPRKVLPAIQWNIDESPNLFRVVLPNGEGIYYDKITKTIVGGALKETLPQDTNPKSSLRSFNGFEYNGSGVMIQMSRRGANVPSAGTVAKVTKNGKTCQIPSSQLFNQSESDSSFKYPTDDALDAFLKRKCGFGI